MLDKKLLNKLNTTKWTEKQRDIFHLIQGYSGLIYLTFAFLTSSFTWGLV